MPLLKIGILWLLECLVIGRLGVLYKMDILWLLL